MRWFVLLSLLVWRSADACSLIPVEDHVIDPAEVGVDTMPPGPVVLSETRITRGDGGGGDTCSDIGLVGIRLNQVVDDRTAPSLIGFELRQLSGTLPTGFALPATAVRAAAGGWIYLHWGDGATDYQEDFSFEIEITPIDSAGNRGTTAGPFTIADEGSDDGGCSLARNGSGAWLVLLALLSRRSRR